MCGIFGFVGAVSEPEMLLERMATSLVHRGPDDEGTWHAHDVGFGNRRLAIVDLAHGRQPIWNETNDLGLVCNGEIYNAEALRDELSARHRFRTRTDVEVILHLYEEHGVDCLERLEGMFALALWDRARGRMLLARDRAGEKPLFYARQGQALYFASELRALRTVPGLAREPDLDALEGYLTLGYFMAPDSPFAGVRKLPPGHRLWVSAATPGALPERWWDLRPHLAAGGRRREPSSLEAQAAELRSLFVASVRKQLMGEVPVGVALSGGIDSAWIAHTAQRCSEGPLHTFTLAFADRSFDESDAAADLADRLGTVHHAVRVGTDELRLAMGRVLACMDEPLGDPAVLPTYLLACAAVREVKVLLGGEGADELLAGYPTYLGHHAVTRYRKIPRLLRTALLEPLLDAWPASKKKVTIGFLLKRFVAAVDFDLLPRHELWFGLLPASRARRLLGRSEPIVARASRFDSLVERIDDFGPDPLPALLYVDFTTYLGEGLLTKLDRASMLASLECRAPYLSAPLVEFAASLPVRSKLERLETKRVLRRAAALDLPASWLRRKKRGLSVPLARLFREELASWIDRELEPGRLRSEGLLDPTEVSRLLMAHRSGRQDCSRAIWGVLSLAHWHRQWILAEQPPSFEPEPGRRAGTSHCALR